MLSKLVFVIAVYAFAASLSFAQKTAETKPIQTDKQKTVIAPLQTVDSVVKLIEGKVTDVFDGDTLSVETKDRKVYAVRMLGIDAPEDKQTHGAKSKKRLSDLISGKKVTVLVKRMDVYNRYLGTVYLKGKDINLELIKTGMAWHHAPYARELRADDRKAYSEAEQKARAEKIGLWKDANPLPPWDYSSVKNTQITNNKDNKQIVNQAKQDEKQSTAPIVLTKTGVKAESTKAEAPTPNPNKSPQRKYIRGERGGCYYINSNGNKTYVDRSVCD